MAPLRTASLSAAVLLLALLAGCSSEPRYYEPNRDAAWTFRPGQSLVVIAGLGDRVSVRFAEELTRVLSESSSFSVTNQQAVRAAFPDYPANILDDARQFSDSDIPKIQRIQRRLGTDYVLVAWNAGRFISSREGVDQHIAVGFMCRLLGFPGARELGWSAFSEGVGSAWTRSAQQSEAVIVRTGVEQMASEFLRRTGMRK